MQSLARYTAALLLALAALALGLSTPAAPLLAIVAIAAQATEPAPARSTLDYTDSEYLAYLLANEPRGVRYA